VAFGATSSTREGHSAGEDEAESSAGLMEQGHGAVAEAECVLAIGAGLMVRRGGQGRAGGRRCPEKTTKPWSLERGRGGWATSSTERCTTSRR
jgi:hypothetical protein